MVSLSLRSLRALAPATVTLLALSAPVAHAGSGAPLPILPGTEDRENCNVLFSPPPGIGILGDNPSIAINGNLTDRIRDSDEDGIYVTAAWTQYGQGCLPRYFAEEMAVQMWSSEKINGVWQDWRSTTDWVVREDPYIQQSQVFQFACIEHSFVSRPANPTRYVAWADVSVDGNGEDSRWTPIVQPLDYTECGDLIPIDERRRILKTTQGVTPDGLRAQSIKSVSARSNTSPAYSQSLCSVTTKLWSYIKTSDKLTVDSGWTCPSTVKMTNPKLTIELEVKSPRLGSQWSQLGSESVNGKTVSGAVNNVCPALHNWSVRPVYSGTTGVASTKATDWYNAQTLATGRIIAPTVTIRCA